jgi:hypothetical protein
MITFTIKRSGDFSVKTFGPNHCGTSENLKVRYNLSVVCLEGSLDQKGFLFDQTKVQIFFDRIKTTHLSCEEFCYTASRKLYTAITTVNPKAKIAHFELELSPEPFAASLTFTYEADEVPAAKAAPAEARRVA